MATKRIMLLLHALASTALIPCLAVAAVTVEYVELQSKRLTVRQTDGKVITYQLSAEQASNIRSANPKLNDRLLLDIQANGTIAGVWKPGLAGQNGIPPKGDATQSRIAERQESITGAGAKPSTPATPKAPQYQSGRPDPTKPTVGASTQQSALGERTSTSNNATVQRDFRTFDDARQTKAPSGTTAAQAKATGDSAQLDLTFRGADPTLTRGSWVRDTLGRIADAIGLSSGKDSTYGGSGGGGVRGMCPDTSDVCAATGRTWGQLTKAEKLNLCKEFKNESDKVKGISDQSAVSVCAAGISEPSWAKVFGIRADPLIHTTEDQGRQTGTSSATKVPQAGGKQGDLVRTLKDPSAGNQAGPIAPSPKPPITTNPEGGRSGNTPN